MGDLALFVQSVHVGSRRLVQQEYVMVTREVWASTLARTARMHVRRLHSRQWFAASGTRSRDLR